MKRIPSDAQLERAAEIIRAGGIVAMPTETVYGLAADATNDRAVARIYEAKGRPSFNPLIAHCDALDMARRYVLISPLAEELAAAFWPGSLTLVLPRAEDAALSHLTTAGLEYAAIRIPAHPVALALVGAVRKPLAAPSANPSGAISPTTADHVREGLGDRVDLVLDAGPCAVGVESTIIKIEGERVYLLRPGGVGRADIEAVIRRPLEAPQGDQISSPGMLASHYAPESKIRLDVEAPAPDEAYLGFAEFAGEGAAFSLNLSSSGDMREAAANFFSHLRRLDAAVSELALSGIAAAPVPTAGLGEAINDRLKRAAAPK